MVLGLCLPVLYAPAALEATPPGTISTYAGGGPNNVAAISANVPYPANTAVDKHGNFYFVTGLTYGSAANRVYEVNTSGVLR